MIIIYLAGRKPVKSPKNGQNLNIRPSIANQDFKIYGLLGRSEDTPIGIPAKYCGELLADWVGAVMPGLEKEMVRVIDGFVFDDEGNIVRLVGGLIYFNAAISQMETIDYNHTNRAYYDALWAIQQAEYAADGTVLAEGTEFSLPPEGMFGEIGIGGQPFINEDGYRINGTSADGKLASLYLGEKVENPEGYAVVRLESILPLVGELPLDTTEIW